GAAVGLVIDIDHLGLGFDRQLVIEDRCAADFIVLPLPDSEAFGDHADGVSAGGQGGKAVLPGGVRCSALLSARAAQLYQRVHNVSAGWVGYSSAKARGRRLCLQRRRATERGEAQRD